MASCARLIAIDFNTGIVHHCLGTSDSNAICQQTPFAFGEVTLHPTQRTIGFDALRLREVTPRQLLDSAGRNIPKAVVPPGRHAPVPFPF